MLLAVAEYRDAFKIIEVVVGTITFLIVISYIFKDSSVYKMLTHILLGTATAITIVVLYRSSPASATASGTGRSCGCCASCPGRCGTRSTSRSSSG
jgi:hypothetical protein